MLNLFTFMYMYMRSVLLPWLINLYCMKKSKLFVFYRVVSWRLLTKHKEHKHKP